MAIGEHPTPAELGRWAREVLPKASDEAHRAMELTLLPHAALVPDSSTVALIRDATGAPQAILLCSAPASPDLVARGARRARRARQALGPSLGAHVLTPLAEGSLQGLSCAVMPYCSNLSDSRALWAVQRALLRPALLDWLWGATRITAVDVAPAAVEPAYAVPLRHLLELPALSAPLRAGARRALARLGAGDWRPRQVLEHGDLWKGNVLTRRASGPSPEGWAHRFMLIDWPGSEVRGYAVYDLVRLALSLKLGPGRLAAEVARHCSLLRCAHEDASSHLLAALGHVALTLEHFPPERFAATAEACYRALEEAAA